MKRRRLEKICPLEKELRKEKLSLEKKDLPEKLKSKVFKYKPLEHNGRKYYPACEFGYHVGIVLAVEVCETRKCGEYRRLYLDLAEVVFPK